MEITEVRVRRVASDTKMKAVASVTFDNEFVVHEIRVIEGDKGPFIAMPSRKVGEVYKDTAHPIATQMRERLTEAILEEYRNIPELPEPFEA